MSWTAMPNAMNQGVRRLHTLGALWGLGTAPDPSTLAELQAAGYDMGVINTAVALGATDEQLLALPFPASPQEISDATQQLMNTVGGGLPFIGQPGSSAPSYPSSGQPTFQPISVAPGVIQVAPGVYQPTVTPGASIAPGIVAPNPANPSVAVTPMGARIIPAQSPLTVPPAPPRPGLTFEQWIMANAGWVIGIFAAVVILPPLIKKL